MIHGGDIYDKKIELDYSVNVNPYGPDERIRQAMIASIDHVIDYPEYGSGHLQEKLAQTLKLPEEYITLTSGASEAFLSTAAGLKPATGLLQSPSFYGYEYALSSVDADIKKVPLDELLDGDEASKVDMIFVASPNNPTGLLVEHDKLVALAAKCLENGTYMVVDECFLPLTGYEENTLINDMREHPELMKNVIVVRSFTKTFAIPGVRLGYLVCPDAEVNTRIRKHLPEWNLSVMAQMAGVAAIDCIPEMKAQVQTVMAERERLYGLMKEIGLEPQQTNVNFILFKGPEDLKMKLIDEGVLIRDCSNFTGLGKGWFRVAVRRPEENDKLINTMRKVL